MDDYAKAAWGAAGIIAIGIVMGGESSRERRYSIVPISGATAAYRLDRETGEVAFCIFGSGCRPVERDVTSAPADNPASGNAN